MSHIDDDQLISLCLLALEEIVREAQHQPGERTIVLRAILACLASGQRGERWPYDQFWRAHTDRDDIARRANLGASLSAIYRLAGRQRPVNPSTTLKGKACFRGANRSKESVAKESEVQG